MDSNSSVLAISTIKSLIKKKDLLHSVLVDRKYSNTFMIDGLMSCYGESLQLNVVLDFITVNYKTIGYTDRTISKSRWLTLLKRIDRTVWNDMLDNLKRYYKLFVLYHKDCSDGDTVRILELERRLLVGLHQGIVSTCDLTSLHIDTSTSTHLDEWITEEDMYSVHTETIPKAILSDSTVYTHECVRERIHSTMMENLFYRHLGIMGPSPHTIKITAVEYLYDDDMKRTVYSLIGLPDCTVRLDDMQSIVVEYPKDCSVMSPGTTVKKYKYVVYADRSNQSMDYANIRKVIVPFSSSDYNYIVYHESHKSPHIIKALDLSIMTGKSTKIVNTYEGSIYTITSKLSTLDIDYYNRMIRVNTALQGIDLHSKSSIKDYEHVIVVDDEHNEGNVYEKAAIVYNVRLKRVIDLIVLTNRKATIDTSREIVIPDGRDCHRFVIDDVGEDPDVSEKFTRFIQKYPNASIVHYGGDEGKDPLYRGRSIVDIMKVYADSNGCKWRRLREAYHRTISKTSVPVLFHRAFEDCIATLLIALRIPVLDLEHIVDRNHKRSISMTRYRYMPRIDRIHT